MSLESKTLKLCSCNGTIPLEAKSLAGALRSKQPLVVHTELCRKEAAQFQAALAEPDLIVACTQEAALFSELAAGAQSQARISFVNIRESAGWSAEGRSSGPKIAALLAAAALPEPEPVPQVDYKSDGELLIVGPAEAALDWAGRLGETLQVSVLGLPAVDMPNPRFQRHLLARPATDEDIRRFAAGERQGALGGRQERARQTGHGQGPCTISRARAEKRRTPPGGVHFHRYFGVILRRPGYGNVNRNRAGRRQRSAGMPYVSPPAEEGGLARS